MLFLILTLETTMIKLELNKELRIILSSFAKVSGLILFVFVICFVKGKMTRKVIN